MGLLRYANQQKTRSYFHSARLQLPREGSKAGNGNLLTEADVVNSIVAPAVLRGAVANKEMRPGSYESLGTLTRPLGKTPITDLNGFIRRELKRVNPESVSSVGCGWRAVMHRYWVPFPYQGQIMLAKLTVKEFARESEGSRIYSVEAVDVVKPAGNWVPSISEDRRNYTPQAGFAEKLQRKIDEIKENSSRDFSSDRVEESQTPYQGFRLRPAGATRYVNSNTGVLFADGHEIKTTAAAPGEIPAGGGMLWDRLRETSRRSALLDTWQAVHDDPAYTEWLVDLLDRAPSGRDFNLAPARFLPSTMNSCWVPVDSFSNTSMPVCEFFSNPKHGCPVE